MVTVDALIAGDFAAFWDAIRHLVLPATVLAIPFAAQLFRTVRASLLSVLSQEYTLLARAKGASDVRILLRHAFPNSLSPVVDMAGLEFGGMIGAAILVETVFARSGIGLYLADTVIQKDVNAALGCVLFVGVAIALANLATDVIQLSLDPQVRASRVYGRP
jgi:peptide/nickel transport system permease protein